MIEGRYRFRALGSPCELRLYGRDREQIDAAAAAAREEVARIERKYSRYRGDSLLSAINSSAGDRKGIDVDPETARLLDHAATCWEQSDGLFDVTSGVLRQVWDFRSGKVPQADEVAAALERVGWARVTWRSPRLVLPLAGMELDLGGIGKEYAVDRAVARCREQGVRCGMVDLGGDLGAVGPNPEGEPWRVGVRDPRRPETALASIPMSRGGLASSGDYERCMIVDGVRYSHILDPRTGWPIDGGLNCVSVQAPCCLIAGSAATIAMLKGEGEGPAWLDALGLPNLRMTRDGGVGGTIRPA